MSRIFGAYSRYRIGLTDDEINGNTSNAALNLWQA
jgi:hypothetical protein